MSDFFSDIPDAPRPPSPRVKPGARIDGVDPKLIDFAARRNFTITSGNDSPGVHVRNSRHGRNAAVDLRVWDKKPEEVAQAIADARAEGLNVLDETRGPRPHLHISTGGVKQASADDFFSDLPDATPSPAISVPTPSPEAGATLPAISQTQPAPAGAPPPPLEPNPAPEPSLMSRAQLEAYQRRLERRGKPPVVSLPTPKLASEVRPKLPARVAGFDGARESANVEDARPPAEIAESARAGRLRLSQEDRYAIARFLEQSLDERQFNDFARALSEGREPDTRGVSNPAEMLKVFRLLDVERRERPEQFMAAASNTEFGERLHAVVDPLAEQDVQPGEEVVREAEPPPVLTPRTTPSVYTPEGRALRDRKVLAEKEGGALYRIPVGTGRPEEAAQAGVNYLAKETDASPEFVADWLKRNNLGLQFGEQQSAPTGFAVIPTEAVGRLRRDYRASLSLPARAVANVREIAATHSPGEALVGVGGEAASGAMRGMDIGTRPLQAASGAFWAKIRGANNRDAVEAAVQEFYGENPELAKNVIAEALRDSETLKGINPRLPELTGFLAEMVADPANLIPAGLVARGVSRVGKTAKAGGRLARVAGELRDLGVFVPDVPKEAFKAAGDSRVLGDLTRRVDAVNVPDVADEAVNAGFTSPRVVKRAPETGTETIIRHSDSRIDGGKVIGQTSDGRLKVENNEGGVSVVQHPRKQGNREATLVRREVEPQTPEEVNVSGNTDGRVPDLERAGQRVPEYVDGGPTRTVEGSLESAAAPRAVTPDQAATQVPPPQARAGNTPGLRKQVAPDDAQPIRPLEGREDVAAGRVTVAPKGAGFGKGLTRTYQAGQNRASVTFDSLEQRDLFDLTSRGSDNISLQEKQRRAARKEQVRDDLARRLGISPEEVTRRAFAVRDDVRTQMKGVADGESRTLADNTRTAEAPTPVPTRPVAPVPDAPAFRERIKSTFNLSDEQADAVTELTEARARAWGKERGREASDYYAERFAGIVRGAGDADESAARLKDLDARIDAARAEYDAALNSGTDRQALHQRHLALLDEKNALIEEQRISADAAAEFRVEDGKLHQVNAAAQFLKDGRAVLRAFRKADVASAAHELSHVFRRDLSPELLKDAEDALGVKGKWETAHEEQFARGFERYLKTGQAPSDKLRRVYAQFKDWLTEIYGAVRGKTHPLKYKPNEQLTAVFDRMLDAAPKGEFGQFTNALHKAPSEGTPAFFENAQIKRALGLKPDASTEDVRWKLAAEVGKPRASHVTPEDAIKWADSKNLQGAAREALNSAVEKYRATVKAPTEYQQTGIRKSNVDPTTQSLAEFVRAAGGIRVDRDLANRGELAALTNKEAGTSGLIRKDGISADEMARMAAEAGYPVGSEGGYIRQRGTMELNAGAEEASADTLTQLLARDLQGDKVYSNQREVDYETLYRQQHPEDNTDALDSFLSNEENGILFDKVQDGTATRREVEEFRRAAGEAGLFPEYVRTVVAQGKRAQAEGVQAPVRDEAAGDFDFRDDSVDAEQPAWLYQSDHKPEQLGFVQEGLTQESARRATSKPQLADARTDAATRALGAEEYARLSSLKDSPVARMAVEIERRVNPSNSQNAPDVVAALSKLAELKRTKQTVDDFLNQGSLFGDRELTPTQERILSALDKNPRKVIEEAFPAEATPQQDVLFQSDHTTAARRQRAYKTLLEAKGQGSLSPDLRRNPASRTRMGATRSADPNQPALAPDLEAETLPGRDADLREFFRTPLSNLDFKGTYERLGGEPGKKVSDAFRDAQFRTDERLNDLRKTVEPDKLEEAEKAVRHEELDKLRAALRPLVRRLKDGGKPELAEDVVIHLNALTGAPTKFERGVGNLIRETPGLNRVVKDPDLAMRHAAARLTSLQAILKLKYNVRSSITNLTDPLTTLWPYASTADMAAVYADFLKPSTRKMLKERGVTGGVTKLDEAGLVKTKMGLGDKLSPFRKASEVNRSVAYLYGMKEAKRAGLDGEQAHRLALDWARKVEFDNSVWNAPPALRTSGGKVLGQFKGYAVKSFENLANVVRAKDTDKRFTRAARVSKFVAGKGLVGGLRAGGLLTKTAGYYAAGALAYQLMQRGYSKEEAQAAADAVYYGAPALIGLDLSGSVMMFEPPFGNSLSEQLVNTVGGPTLGTGLKIGQGVADAYKAENGKQKTREEKLKTIGERTLNALSPYPKMAKSAVQTAQGKPTQKLASEEVPVTTYEGVMKALGFTLKTQTKFYDERDNAPKQSGGKGTITVPPPPKRSTGKSKGAY